MPERIQRKRTKGWRLPSNAVYVGRPTAFGNPFPVSIYGQAGAVVKFLHWVTGQMSGWEKSEASTCVESLSVAWHRLSVRRGELRGKDLACWCPLDQACHADILLEWAND